MDSDQNAPRVVLAFRDERLQKRIAALLERSDVRVETSPDDDGDWWTHALDRNAEIVVIRRRQLSSAASQSALTRLSEREDAPEIIVVGEIDEPADRAGMMASGAAGVFDTNVPNPELQAALETVTGALADRGVARPETGGNNIEPRLADFLSRSPRMQTFLDTVERVKSSNSSLLIQGETGIGKEHLARAIHAESGRATKPFVGVNCGAIPEHLLESELFGHERGAFTGATSQRTGLFRQAEGGTIFLDEVSELPKNLQVGLLTVLQRREVQPVGSAKPVPVDVRIMAASNRDLAGEVAAGRFREDLFYRLNVVCLELPPLRARRDDIPELVGTFMRHFRAELDADDVEGIAPDAMAQLLRHDWPGNIRELINVIERAMLLCRGSLLTRADLPDPMGDLPAPETSAHGLPLPPGWEEGRYHDVKRQVIRTFELAYFENLLARTEGRVGECARLAGIAKRTLFQKMKSLGLRKEDYRA